MVVHRWKAMDIMLLLKLLILVLSVNPSVHNSHGKRIDRKAAAEVGVITEELEKDQELQDAVLTVYHIATILFEKSRASKIIGNNKGNFWVKNAIDQN